jgi:hypothetical protein
MCSSKMKSILTLAAGAMFGWAMGLLLVSFASSVGALLAFWVSRYMLRDFIQQRFGKLLEPINQGLAKGGTFYLLTLRLVPVFPFWLINLWMGLTTLGARKFYVVSPTGMLVGTAVYANSCMHAGVDPIPARRYARAHLVPMEQCPPLVAWPEPAAMRGGSLRRSTGAEDMKSQARNRARPIQNAACSLDVEVIAIGLRLRQN